METLRNGTSLLNCAQNWILLVYLPGEAGNAGRKRLIMILLGNGGNAHQRVQAM